MTRARIRLGKEGEAAALRFLKSKGYRILQKNFKTRFAEIDIIAEDKKILCFIEVKTRQDISCGLPRESVTMTKQKKIAMGAAAYLQKANLSDPCMRFDVVEIFKQGNRHRCNLIRNAFQVQ